MAVPGENLTREEARARAALVAVEHYDVDLDLTTGPETFRSTTTVRFTATPGASTFIDLISARVHEVVLNGTALDPAAVADEARIALDGLAAENELLVVADCRYMNTGEGLHRFVDPVDDEVYLYSQFEVADSRRVYAVFEQPDLKAEFTFTVTAPAHWRVVSNAPVAVQHPVEAGTRWTFEKTPRLSSYVTAVIAGPYEGSEDSLVSADGRTIPLGIYCRKSLVQHLDADNVVRATKQGFEFFEREFDRPYPFAKYDQVFVPEFNAGAMENAGAVTFVESYVFRSKVPRATVERRVVTVLHELAHMWFGDLVTMRWWNDLWLNESFAEFASTLAAAEATEWVGSWTTFNSLEKSWAYRQDQLPTTHPIVAEINDLEDVEVNFDGITYAKGASVLKQLVAYVGREEFLSGVRAYFARHAFGNTELVDLLRELETTSGRDLSAWSREWLETAGVATLRPVLTTDADGTVTAASLRQEAPAEHPHLRSHRIALGCYDLVGGTFERTERIELDAAGASTDLPQLVGRKRPDLLLVNDDDLAYAKIRLDESSLTAALQHLDAFRDSLPRSLVSAALWDMTRDGESPARDYVDLLLSTLLPGNAATEDSTVALVLLRQLTTTVELYTDPARREEVRTRTATTLLELLRAAAPGSDTQLQFARAFASFARSEEHLAVVGGLYDGTRAIEGLEVDADMRWALLTALVAGGALGAEAVEAELARDATATGQRSAAAARAAVPTAQAKQRAWADVVERGDLPNAVQASVIAGFGRAHDEALLRPFVEPYFAALRGVWAERTNEMAQQIVTGLYPLDLADAALLERTDRWLAEETDAPPALRRLVLENRDGVARALRAQERDAS
ncbi:aminopeptidase N [Kineococcus radiotolerans SRS30216 = ATCC BAA-149]|uniref:Aminopeptidase N n=1 Tax=Kineococcus radiotolerans (strain ATCC BAA-149 / DSM 14245 / SRS30216) TaxID=266940 RepID=A6WDU9_KINRD|nr:aminopeptidase N [Kineococcus radiotolerans SRS30216 = ATCC BAA-149]